MTDSIHRLACYVEKGGVGKTTTAAHLATAAYDRGLKVILLDLAGTQNDLAAHYGIELDDLDAPVSAVFGDDWEFIVENVDDALARMVYDTGEGPDLIPADPGLGGRDNELANQPREERYTKLAEFVDNQLAGLYDLVIMDLPGKEDNIALNGLYAAENVIAPLSPGEFERNQLHRLEDDIRDIASDPDYPGVKPSLELVVPNEIDRRVNGHVEFADELQEQYGDRAPVRIPRTSDISDAQGQGQTIFKLYEGDLGRPGKAAVDRYRTLADHVLDRVMVTA